MTTDNKLGFTTVYNTMISYLTFPITALHICSMSFVFHLFMLISCYLYLYTTYIEHVCAVLTVSIDGVLSGPDLIWDWYWDLDWKPISCPLGLSGRAMWNLCVTDDWMISENMKKKKAYTKFYLVESNCLSPRFVGFIY